MYNKFRKSVSDQDLKYFSSLKSDVERWKFVENRNQLDFPFRSSEKQKNLEEALNLKNKGNQCFQGGNNSDALRLYTESLMVFPSDGDQIELAVIRANRSAALYHLDEFRAAIMDIDVAFSLGYSKHLHHKALDRKARCQLGLKQNHSALQTFRETLRSLDDAKIPTESRQKKQVDIQIMLGLLTKNKAIDEKIEANENKARIEGELNPRYKSASKAVSFSYSEAEGRFAQANSHIQSGNVILIEKPHSAVLLPENSKTHCFQCLKRVYIAEPCPGCADVIYCSSQCQKVASKSHHKFECKILKTLWDSGASITCLMALRIIAQRTLNSFINLATKLEESENAECQGQYDGGSYTTVYQLVKHESKRSTEDMLHRAYMALFLHDCLKKAKYFNEEEIDEQKKSKGEELIGGLILRHLQSMQFNVHEISELIFHTNDPQSWKSNFVGAGLFPTLALFNHSCDPSIIRYFERSKVVVRAIKNIRNGEHIFENYGPIFTQTSRNERQKTLKNQYWFDCSCEPCTRNWPTIDRMDTSSLRFHCDNSECDNVIVVPMTMTTFMVNCNKCNKLTNILKGLKVLQDTENLFRLGESYLKSGDIAKALEKFLELQSLLSDTLVPPFRDFYLCQQNVRNCLMALGNSHPPLHKFVKKQKA
ncbi:set and mynd domain-containing protein [Nesidiocoris tenuis]|nr:set and mynd domain-containing protein [Nesidiocoris tenuis]